MARYTLWTIAIAGVLLFAAASAQADDEHHDELTSTGAFDPYNCSCVELAEHLAEENGAAAEGAAEEEESHATSASAWISGLAAAIIISAVSLVGVGTFSFVPENHRDHALQALLGLAFGTLIGGTFLDLLPEAAEELGKFDIGVSATCMCGIIFGYLTERLTHWVSGGTHSHAHGGDGGSAGHGHGHGHGAHPDDAPGGHGSGSENALAYADALTAKSPKALAPGAEVEMRSVQVQPIGTASASANGNGATIAAPAPVPSDDPLAMDRDPTDMLLHSAGTTAAAAGSSSTPAAAVQSKPSAAAEKKAAEHDHDHAHAHGNGNGHGHSHGAAANKNQRPGLFGLTPLALLSLSGDAIHNFVDGLVVGAAFVSSLGTGVTTAVAVAVHEIPQEIGDFGILLQSGLSVKQALLANFGVALTCVAGCVVSLSLGQEMGKNVNYALPFAGGVFLYLALSGVVPEMQRYIASEDRDESERKTQGRASGRLLCCGVSVNMTWLAAIGICVGIALMGVLTLLPHEHGGHDHEDEAAAGHAH